MRKLALMAVLASTALATPAFARDGAWYVGVEGGAMIIEDMDFDIAGANNALTVDSDYGFDVDGIVGYDFGGFRLEGEVGYKSADVDKFQVKNAAAAGFPTGVSAFPAGTYGGTGETDVLSFMVNGMLDFGPDDGLNGFVGGGAGIARVKADQYASYPHDTSSKFAWQAIAGVRAPLSDRVDVGLKYRFFNVDNIRLAELGETRLRSHSLLGSLIFNFGEPAAPPPPPPPPPPPAEPAPPPPPPVAVPGPFIVFFDWDKSNITPEAASILDNAAQAYATTGQASVVLAGHADKSGSDEYNVALSQRRADAVKAYLAGKGVPDTSITTEAFGESRPLVETADGVREPQNRRVEITFGPGSGM